MFLCIRHVLIFCNIMKNPLPLEASWWAELRTLFIMSKSTNFTLPPYINFSKYYEKSIIVGIVMKSRFQKTFWNIEGYYFYAANIFNFLRYYENTLPLEASLWAEFRRLFRMSKFIIFIQPQCTYFLKYYETSFIVRSVIMSRIQTTFQKGRVYYCYAAAI